IGFDHDTVESFEHQYRFITEAGIQSAMIGLLTALPKTPLYERLKKEGRLNTMEDVNDMTQLSTNVVPKSMPYDVMVDGYVALYQRLLQDREIALRVKRKLRHLATPAYRSVYRAHEALGILARLIWRGILPGGPRRVAWFLSTIPVWRLSVAPTVISEWVVALSMREFAERRLASHVRHGQGHEATWHAMAQYE
ncbi:MAG: DUF4070 domain-containing protein, partial [Roseiarcus sp.]